LVWIEKQYRGGFARSNAGNHLQQQEPLPLEFQTLPPCQQISPIHAQHRLF